MSGIPPYLRKLVSNLSEENYERTISDYRFWRGIGAMHGWIPDDQLHDDIMGNMNIRLVHPYSQQLIHRTSRLIVQFITDVELHSVSSTHERLCHSTLRSFFADNLDFDSRASLEHYELARIYTNANFLAHWVNLGCLNVEDVPDHILQSLYSRPIPHAYQLNSLYVLLKIAGATFSAYVDPVVMARCLGVLESCGLNYSGIATLAKIIKLSESDWEGLPTPPILRPIKPEITFPKSQDLTATPVAPSLGLPNVEEPPQTPTLPSLTSGHPSDESTRPSSPPSPSTSVSGLSDFTIADSLDGEPIAQPETLTPHDTFYLDDGSVEVACGMTLFRIHTSTLSFHSPVLRQVFSSANLASAGSPNGCPRIVPSDTPTEFEILLKAIYLPEFPDKTKVPDFFTFSSLLRVSTKYEMPNLRAQILETIRDAYPENFEGLNPSKPLGENVFSGPKPHPNAVLNLFVQQSVTSSLLMAYYMAAQRGLDSLMGAPLQSGAALSGQTLKSAMRGLMALRETELREMHRIIFEWEGSADRPACCMKECPSWSSKGFSDEGTMQARHLVFDRITRSMAGGTRILRVLSADEFAGDGEFKFCQTCRKLMEVAHADVRRKAWAMLPEVFGLKT